MERKQIRGAVACLAYAAEVNKDDDLATLLNVVHAAILHNDVHRLVHHLATYDVLLDHTTDEATIRCLNRQGYLLERVVR